MSSQAELSPTEALRIRCAWCPIKHPMDGLGPIPDGVIVSDGACPIGVALFESGASA